MRDPVEGVVAIGGFLVKRLEGAFGFVTAANVFNHHGVAVLNEGLVIGGDIGALPVRCAHQDGGDVGVVGRQKDIGGKADSVPHGNGNVQFLHDGPLRCAKGRSANQR